MPACAPSHTHNTPSREYLEKHYTEGSGRDTLKLALRALTEVVEGSSKNIEVAVVEQGTGLRFLTGEGRPLRRLGRACSGMRAEAP